MITVYRTHQERGVGAVPAVPRPRPAAAGPALPVAAYFARYRQRCLAQLAQHGHPAGATACRCGGPLPCSAEAGLERMLETVVGSGD